MKRNQSYLKPRRVPQRRLIHHKNLQRCPAPTPTLKRRRAPMFSCLEPNASWSTALPLVFNTTSQRTSWTAWARSSVCAISATGSARELCRRSSAQVASMLRARDLCLRSIEATGRKSTRTAPTAVKRFQKIFQLSRKGSFKNGKEIH